MAEKTWNEKFGELTPEQLERLQTMTTPPPSDALPREVLFQLEDLADTIGCEPTTAELVTALSSAYRLGLAQHAGEIARLREAVKAKAEALRIDAWQADDKQLLIIANELEALAAAPSGAAERGEE
jgi:hypothetical protein